MKTIFRLIFVTSVMLLPAAGRADTLTWTGLAGDGLASTAGWLSGIGDIFANGGEI